MSPDEFKAWRKRLGFTQDEAGQQLGVSRATIIAWESGSRMIPTSTDFASRYLDREWKQRPEHGPVTLVYADGPMWVEPYGRQRVPLLQMELYPDNESAIRRACELYGTDGFHNAFINEEGGETILNVTELLLECRRRLDDR